MDALRKFARHRFQMESFANCPQQYDVLTVTPGKALKPSSMPSTASVDELESLFQTMHSRSLLLIKILFDRPLSQHVFHTSEVDLLRLLGRFQIDPYWLDLIANDMTGFHSLGGNDEITSYYLQCAAYKFIWAYDARRKCTQAIALVFNSKKACKAFDECTSIMKANQESVSHPLFLLVSGAVQTVGFFDRILREQYYQCKTTEVNTGFRPWSADIVTRENVLELSKMSQSMGMLVVKLDMIFRRVKQLQLAMEAFKRFQDDQNARDPTGQRISDRGNMSLLSASQIIQSKLRVMEIDFIYVRARAENQRTTTLQMTAREEALTSIQISTSTSRDSTSMKVIAVMTMVFLPGTFFATLFAVPSLQWNTTPVIQDNFWIYWAFTLPATTLVLLAWVVCTKGDLVARLWPF